ncbi:sulfatase-like hydrolase/transferase [Nocardia sp. NEAU-G5]|uniref:Sulfatase-like hydrolase/transferase n=1 Tax=Nocardia albiluteola TaxID=2842303 RepID=A0ABS6BC08_9NOCA|nr:sulfatase-like hydrolase/transferase [Nocardia albiluteola]
MKAIMAMFDSLNRRMLPPYGCDWTDAPNFARLAERAVTFDNAWAGSMPCMPARHEIHTGRHNFLHRSWGPLEPFDDSMPELLKQNGIHTHLASDHAGLCAGLGEPQSHADRGGAFADADLRRRSRVHPH